MEKLILKNASEVAASLKAKLEDGVEEIAWKGTNDAKKLKEDDDKTEDMKEKGIAAAAAAENRKNENGKIEEIELPSKERNGTDDAQQKEPDSKSLLVETSTD